MGGPVNPKITRFLSETRKRFRLIVDVRRRHEIIFKNICETIKASDVKIYLKVALDSLNSLSGNDVINCLRSKANRTNV